MKKMLLFLLLMNMCVISAQNITWTDISANYTLPNGVKIFSGEDASIPLKLKYIDIDLNDNNLELTPELSSNATHARNWAKNLGAIAVMNGGYFGGNTSFSAVVNNTVEARNVSLLNRDGLAYPVTRGFFGFNTNGTMEVNWIYHFGNEKEDIYSFANPTPNAEGSPAPTPNRNDGTQWLNLMKGLGAGPVLIKNGNIVDSYTEEVFWGSGVPNTGLSPRSAMGYTADNHVILLAIDGREFGVTDGTSLPQTAAILKDLGCVEALNFDGGGSTQLATPDAFINTPSESYRSVPSVWAVYKKINLETPVPISPADQSSTENNPVQLSWNMPTETGTTYRIQIATSKENFNKRVGFTPDNTTNSTVLVNEENTTGNYNFTNLILGNTYYWSVIAYKSGGFQSYYSEPISFMFSNGVELDWSRAANNSNLPTWFGSNSERGFAYANNKIYVVSRSSDLEIKTLNVFDGTDVGQLSVTGISGGTFSLNDIEASENGMLLGCNLTVNTGSSNFKIYKWENETSNPEVYIDYSSDSNLRLGDKFTLLGDISKNAVILAAAPGSAKIVRWLIIDGVLQAPTEITLTETLGNQPSITATGTDENSDLIVNSQAKNIILYSATGVNKGSLGTDVIDNDSNTVKYFELDGKKYLAIFQSKQNTGSPIGNNARILDITDGFNQASIITSTERLGDVANGNASGDVAVRLTNDPVSLTLITLATNNGISAKRIFGIVIPDGESNNTLGVSDAKFSLKESINIYPNPASTSFTISFSDVMDAKSIVSIYAINGKLIRSEKIEKNNQNINIESLAKGLYLIKVQNGKANYQLKFIKS